MSRRGTWLSCMALLVSAACGEPDVRPGTPARSGPPVVAVTCAPLAYVAARMGGDLVRVVEPLPPEADPAWWRPTPEVIADFQSADLVLANGARFERWLGVASLPRARLVQTAAALPEPLIEVADGTVHSHGKGGAHSHAGVNGHTWVDPTNLRVQASAVRDALVGLLPAAEGDIRARHLTLDADLKALAAAYAALPPLGEGEVLVASHPVYEYLGRRLGWTLLSLDWAADQVPRTGALDALVGRLQGRTARAMLWEAAPRAEAAEAVAARIGARSIVVDPGAVRAPADRAAGRDWLAAQRANVERLRAVLDAP